jgi:hypothetical protein
LLKNGVPEGTIPEWMHFQLATADETKVLQSHPQLLNREIF